MSLPDRKLIKDVFEGLLGRDVAVGDGTPISLDAPRPVVATYIDPAHHLATLAVMDLPLAAYSGAALALIPKGGAEAAVEDQLLPDNLFENVSEILNVLAAPIGDCAGVHQRLETTFAPHDPLPGQIASYAATLGAREDVTLDIAGYGSGTLSIVTVFA
ncbi:hypothetical protein [Nocardioides sp. T2.26MG-1]|uniref:hypothetical protein n=1 Tax=Nocardioides sp. T2.26MG-1 TaxID=3041166 RepID=UPI00247786FA|nr:hypothetical protein [Nocardioides sp. T2.26MG-1]CAI9405641.1 hypothetical protein HIDPHFAB_04426 [Nocardioides sp. T2.26MG-1]